MSSLSSHTPMLMKLTYAVRLKRPATALPLRQPSGIQKAPSHLANAISQPHNPASPSPSNLPNQPPALKHATPISRSRPPMTPFLPCFLALSNLQIFWKVTLSK
ncbi:hypothetical protein HBI18_059860 [Parastagonospora nodorum]|nr:hypothetical protein HBH43_102430 [Parastagonospora nodorum]KAH4603543.1 hypothetical protein HBH82_149190 [Parastagonospora nodorum]KAH4683983.1 hypothetical protein HBH78_117150 [Parastagonospora nodorum]KAH4704744.1 hypothetical protein HBH67_098030 [Parastagonospora nodorum]KAH4790945.1 hypothetical protein HBH62_037130 [Parastagonospora nodorum]